MRSPRSVLLARATSLAACAVIAAAVTTGSKGADTVPRPMDVAVDGRMMHIVCSGPTDGSRPTAVFEAGYGGDSREFADVIGRLAAMDVSACASIGPDWAPAAHRRAL